ncbi:MAG: hypothetical protein WDW38_008576 [Sanguina aurantia]
MSGLLRTWLEDICPNLENIEKEFASGYEFGRVFAAFNMQPDFNKFVSARFPDAMINNFTRLQPTFTKLGVRMDTRTANSLMREEAGVAAKLLYTIKQTLGQLNKDLQKLDASGKLGRTMGTSTVASRGLLDATTLNTQHSTYDASAARQFEDTMRNNAENPNALREAVHLERFSREGTRQARNAARALVDSRAAAVDLQATARRGQLDRMGTARSDKSLRLQHDDAVHASLLKRKEAAEREDLRVELALAEKGSRHRLEELSHASLDVHHGIDAFEINMKRLVKADAGEGEGVGPAGSGPVGRSPLEHMSKLQGMASSGAALLEGSAVYMKGVKEGRAEDVAARKEREARRRKLLVEQQASAVEVERQAATDALVASLARQSGEEQRLAARLWQLRQEKAIMVENRALREGQYAERRERDWEETLRRETELHRSLHEQYKHEAELEAQAWRAAQALRASDKAAAHEALAREVAWQLVMLSERTSEYRESTGVKVPKREWREWLGMFVAGDPALGSPVTQDTPGMDADTSASNLRARTTALEYLACTGDFERSSEEGPIGPHDTLGALVAELASGCRPPPAEPRLPLLDMPLRLAVVGSTFAGKTTVAQALAKSHRLRVLDPERLIEEAVAAAAAFTAAQSGPRTPSAPPPPPPQPASGTPSRATTPPDDTSSVPTIDPAPLNAHSNPHQPSPKAALGLALTPLLLSGADVPDTLLTQLMVLGMMEAREYAPTVMDPESKGLKAGAKLPVKAALPTKAMPGAPSVPAGDRCRGFVMDGYPRTRAQAALLEQMLTGLDLEGEQSLIEAASRLAPPPPSALPQLRRPLTSGLDAVIVLGLADDMLTLKRAVGRRVDPTTGKVYHLEFDPPPSDDPGLSARLQGVTDGSNDGVQVQQRLSAYATTSTPLDDWVKKFKKLRRPIEGSSPLREVLASANDVVESLLSAHAAAAAVRGAADGAHKAKQSAELAQGFAEAAQTHAEAAARELLAAKKAEIQASALLVDPKSKNPDQGATEVLKLASAARCAEHLKVCKAAASDAAGHAERAAESAAAAADASLRAERCLGDAEVSAHAEAEAADAATDAETASKAAAAAAAKAETAKLSAEVAVAEAERISTAADVPADAQLHLAAQRAAVATAAAAAESSVDPSASALPPLPQSVPRDIAGALYEEWRALEASYLSGLELQFAGLSEEQGACVLHFSSIQAQFKALLERPDGKQAILARFLSDFNAVDVDVRRMKETRGELLLRAEELREALWGVCDRKAEEAEAEQAKVQYNMLKSDSDFSSPDLLSGIIPLDLKDKVDPKSKTALAFPAFIARLDTPTGSPSLALAVKVAWATAVAVAATMETAVAPDPKKGKKETAAAAKPAVKKKGEEVAVGEEKSDPGVSGAVTGACLSYTKTEMAILEARLTMLADRALSSLGHIHQLCASTKAKLAEWVRARYAGECSAVAALVKIVKEAAHKGRELPFDLRLEDDLLLVDQASFLTQTPQALAPSAPEEEPLPAGLLSTRQLAQLASCCKQAAPTGWMKLGDAADLMCRLVSDGSLPPGWHPARPVQALSAMRLYDPVHSSYMDWRELLASLVVAAFPLISKADCAEMADQVDPSPCGSFPPPKQGLSQSWTLNLTHTLLHSPRSAGALKRVLWTAFATTPTNDPDDDSTPPLLDYTALLLYLCTDRDVFSGIKKAFSVASNNIAGNARASAEQIFRVMYPLGPDAGANVCRSPVSLESVRQVVRAVHASRGGSGGATATGEARISAEHFMYSVAGDKVAKQTLDRYQWKDAYIAMMM